MPLGSKYDFVGLKKYGALALATALSSTPWGSWVVTTWGVRHIFDLLAEWAVNWAVNNGLMVINIAAINVEGKWDQAAFDRAMDDALGQVERGGLTPAQIKEIDEKVIQAFRKFAVFTNHDPDGLPPDADVGLRDIYNTSSI